MIAPAPHAHTFKHSTLTMQPVHYHYIKQPVKHMEKNTALFKYVVQSVSAGRYTGSYRIPVFIFLTI